MKRLLNFISRLGITTLLLWGNQGLSYAQDDLLKQLEFDTDTERQLSTFNGTRLINGHSVETRETGTLDFLISHRFGRLNSGAYNFFGLDDANIRLGLDYGISDRLNIGLGRNSYFKTFDGFLKYKLFWQKTGPEAFPFSMVWFSNIAVTTLRRMDLEQDFNRRLANTHQLLIARKFTDKFSLQITPTYIHRKLVEPGFTSNNFYAIGLGSRYKLTPSTSMNVEYFYRFDTQMTGTYNALAIGFDIETGGHVFQLHLTNARAMTETDFIPMTQGNFFEGNIHFGFNITRAFYLK